MMSTNQFVKAALRRLPVVFALALLSACGGGGGSSGPANQPPVPQNLTLSLPQGSFITFSLQGTDPENDVLTFSNSTLPANGAITGPSSGYLAGMSPLQYRPNASFSGIDTLVFTLDDGNGGTSQGSITFYVQPYADSNADTDGDGLTDTREIQLGTNPILADTDGDGFSDYEEVVTNAFDANVNNLRFNPLIADTPKIQIEVTSPPDFALNYTTDAGTTTSISTNNAITNGTSVATSSSNEKTHSWAYANSIGAEVTVGYSMADGWNGSLTASYGHEETVTNDSTVAYSSENVQENSTTVDRGQAFESSNNITYADGDIDTTVRITNSGHITYTLDNLFLSAFTISRGPNGEEFGSVGQMVFTDVGNNPFAALALAPGQTTTQLNFTAAGVDLGQMQSLMQNSVGLTIKPAIYNLLDSSGKAYNFSATNIGTQTAKVIVDFVNTGGRKTIEEAIAVHGDPAKNVTILDALQSTLKLNTTIADANGDTVDVNGNPIVRGAIDSIDGLANNGVYAHWMVVHAQQQGNNQVNTLVYTTADEVVRWQSRSANYVGNLNSDVDFSQTVLNAGDVIHLIYLQDDDLDGLSNSEEFLYGTNSQLADSDSDGIDDNTEVKGWEIAYTDRFGSNIYTRVYSDPTIADTDGDGLTDAEELNMATTDPFKRRDPTTADTDGDALLDMTDDRDASNLLDISGYDSSMIQGLNVSAINASKATVQYTLPALLAEPVNPGGGISSYTVYLLSKSYPTVATSYPDIDRMPTNGTLLNMGQNLSCVANAAPTDTGCAWQVVDIKNWSIFPVSGPVTFIDNQVIPTGGSMAYKALVVTDGVFSEYPINAPASVATDIIEISMNPGSFMNKKTLMGLHGIPRARNTWTHSLNEWLLTGTKYYHPYQYWLSDGLTGGGERFYVYDVTTRAQQADRTQWITFAWGATDQGEFIGDYVYSSAGNMNGYLNKTEVGDGELDIRWQLLFDGSPLFTAPANGEVIDGSAQAEVLDATSFQAGPTNTTVVNAGVTTHPDIFTQYGTNGVFSQTVVAANSGVCHTLQVVIQERDKERSQFNSSPTQTTTYKVCPRTPSDGTWDVKDVSGNIITNLLKNNALTDANLSFVTNWAAPSTIQATVNGSMVVRIK